MLHKKSDKRCYISVCRFFGRVQTYVWERFMEYVCIILSTFKKAIRITLLIVVNLMLPFYADWFTILLEVTINSIPIK